MRGSKKFSIFLYYEMVSKLEWDSNMYCWLATKTFMNYTSILGREVLRSTLEIPITVRKKLSDLLPSSYKLK